MKVLKTETSDVKTTRKNVFTGKFESSDNLGINYYSTNTLIQYKTINHRSVQKKKYLHHLPVKQLSMSYNKENINSGCPHLRPTVYNQQCIHIEPEEGLF